MMKKEEKITLNVNKNIKYELSQENGNDDDYAEYKEDKDGSGS